jgi:hypothetical protein
MTTSDETPPKSYSATIGVYVRTYGSIEFQAESDEAATAAAIVAFKQDASFEDFDWNNLAFPSIVSLASDANQTIAEGIDFPLSPEDARDMASGDLLAALEGILQWWEATSFRLADDEPSAIIEARAAIAKAKAV